MRTSHDAPRTPTEQLIAAMEEQTSWLRALAMPQVRKAIEQTLTKTAMRKAYEASDGERTLREVAAAADASTGSISGWWARWRAVGIGVEVGGGRVKHLVTLKDLGVPINIEED
jgi:hypothetical protein